MRKGPETEKLYGIISEKEFRKSVMAYKNMNCDMQTITLCPPQ